MIQTKANSEDPDEIVHFVPYHLDLDCLHRYLFWFAGLNGLVLSKFKIPVNIDVALPYIFYCSQES